MKMKKLYLLTITMWVLAGNTQAQIQLPSTVRAHWDQLPAIAQDYLTTLESWSAPAIMKQQSKSPVAASLDSTITYDIFDIGGGNTILTPVMRDDYFYISPNSHYITTSGHDGNSWYNLDRVRLTYDDLGRLLVSIAETYDAEFGIWLPDSRFRVYPYNLSNTLMDSLLVEGWSKELNTWERLLTVKNAFDIEGRFVESVSDLKLDSILISFKDVYTYDVDGKNTSIETFLLLEGVEIPAGIEVLEYDLGLLWRSTSSVYDEFGMPIPTDRVEYTYIFNVWFLESVKTLVRDDISEEWTETSLTFHTYDMYGRTTSVEYTTYPMEPGELTERTVEAFEYRDDHQISVVINSEFDHVSESYVPQDITFYFYDEITSSIGPEPVVHQLTFGPNPTHGTVQVYFEEEATVDVLSMSGQVLMQLNRSHGTHRLDISDLPAGNYILSLRTQGSTFVGKLVKL
jgi:hypothetical protein